MAKIKVGELKQIKKEFCEDIEVCDFHGLELEVKQYLPIAKKIELIMNSYLSATDEEEFDDYLLGISFRVFMIESYTNLTLPKDLLDAFDLITQTKTYNFVYKSIPRKEIDEIEELLEKYVSTKEKENERKHTVSYILKQGMESLIGKLPSQEYTEKFIEALSKETNKTKKNKTKKGEK